MSLHVIKFSNSWVRRMVIKPTKARYTAYYHSPLHYLFDNGKMDTCFNFVSVDVCIWYKNKTNYLCESVNLRVQTVTDAFMSVLLVVRVGSNPPDIH